MNIELLEHLVPLKLCAILYCESINVCSDLLQLTSVHCMCVLFENCHHSVNIVECSRSGQLKQ